MCMSSFVKKINGRPISDVAHETEMEEKVVGAIYEAYHENQEFRDMVKERFEKTKEQYEWLREDIRKELSMKRYMQRIGIGATYETFVICGLC